jgi:rhodanese-related sulfurtransferase
VTFLLDNILLVVLAVVSGGLLLWPMLSKRGNSEALSPLEATQLINHRNAIIVDVRDEKDFAVGSLAGARNIPNDKLKDRVGELARFKARPVLVICAAGQQSSRALAAFKEQGFAEAYSLAGGINAWKQAALPLVQAGRDNARPAAKEPSRKVKNDNRARASKAAAIASEAANVESAVEPAVEPAGAVTSAALPVAETLHAAEESSPVKAV